MTWVLVRHAALIVAAAMLTGIVAAATTDQHGGDTPVVRLPPERKQPMTHNAPEGRDDGLYFDRLGIDFVFADETPEVLLAWASPPCMPWSITRRARRVELTPDSIARLNGRLRPLPNPIGEETDR